MIVSSLFKIVRTLSEHDMSAISRPELTALALGSFAQMTPSVPALRFTLSVPGVRNLPQPSKELRRLKAGLQAIDETGVDLEYARIADAQGASLLARKSLPNLAAIEKQIAMVYGGTRWSQVKIPVGSTEATVGAAMALFASCRGVPKALQNDPVEDSD